MTPEVYPSIQYPTKVHTDRGCKHQTIDDLRRSGGGVFLGPNHPANVAFPRGELEQSSGRAELEAVVAVSLLQSTCDILNLF